MHLCNFDIVMAVIVHINTALEGVSVCLAADTEIKGFAKENERIADKAFLHVALHRLLKEASLSVNDIDAVAVANGPGSYTGLRIGLAAAKGLCFSLNKPLITLNTLEVMAGAAPYFDGYICPMIDARRMEVYTAVYTPNLELCVAPCAMILDSGSFSKQLEEKKMLFLGSGSNKFQQMMQHPNAFFCLIDIDARNMVNLAVTHYRDDIFSDIAYVEPYYMKEFYIVK